MKKTLLLLLTLLCSGCGQNAYKANVIANDAYNKVFEQCCLYREIGLIDDAEYTKLDIAIKQGEKSLNAWTNCLVMQGNCSGIVDEFNKYLQEMLIAQAKAEAKAKETK